MSASKKAPTKKAPTKKAPTKKAPTKKAPTQKAPTQKAPMQKAPTQKALTKAAVTDTAPKRHRVFGVSFASLYPLYVKKVESKGRTRAELDEVIAWLTGWEGPSLARVIDQKVDLEGFYAMAPRMNPNVGLITGVVCGVRVEEVADPVMRRIRMLDKLVDELAKGKKMSSILRRPGPS